MKRALFFAVLALSVAGFTAFSCVSDKQSVKKDQTMEQTEKSGDSLIPRSLLFGNPERRTVRMSPDGKYISFIAPLEGALNIYVALASDVENAKPLTKEKGRGLYMPYFWAYTSKHIVYIKDDNGDENWAVHALDVETGEDKAVTPEKKVQARIENLSYKRPNEILVSLNDRNPKYHELYVLNLKTGELKRVQENDRFDGFVTDDDYNVRFAKAVSSDGGSEIFAPDGKGGWKTFMKITSEDALTTFLFDFDKSGKNAYIIDSRGRDKGALFSLNVETMKQTLIAENEKSDINNLFLHPVEKNVIATVTNYERTTWQIVDKTWEEDFSALKSPSEGELQILSATSDVNKLLVCYLLDNGPISYFIYDRQTKKTNFLFVNDKRIKELKLSKMYPKVINSRDGLSLISYLTIPRSADAGGKVEKPLPMVLLVHGGPWHRDAWGYNPEHQWLADRGYIALSVNYRGSTGFGKGFINAANLQWGAKMHDDLIDAVNWAVKEGYADASKVAIMGWSYGGYATLAGLTMTPDTFACGIAGVGPANLVTFMENIPPYWAPLMEILAKRIGDPRTEEGKKFLLSRSPLTYVDKIKKPLLIGHGKNDPRVKLSESEQIVNAMAEKKIPVVFALYPDEGHGFARPQNRMSFYSMAEIMLGRCLGGKSAPIGDDFVGSSATVPVGLEILPDVKNALQKQ